ncbi:UNVERIFIED_CONTAM: hypothetical protein Sradi_0204300 [Sesamum radiatum]|uniref:Uncharacterized protein n=1 Tax=Sesamum radiatum TaxID=300843 RepID=A0AAW2VZ12_SESRA
MDVSDTGSSKGGRRREPAISRAEVDDVGRQIQTWGAGGPEQKFAIRQQILSEVVDPTLRLSDLPKYDGIKDPQEHALRLNW